VVSRRERAQNRDWLRVFEVPVPVLPPRLAIRRTKIMSWWVEITISQWADFDTWTSLTGTPGDPAFKSATVFQVGSIQSLRQPPSLTQSWAIFLRVSQFRGVVLPR
jgi:hypothetical protein